MTVFLYIAMHKLNYRDIIYVISISTVILFLLTALYLLTLFLFQILQIIMTLKIAVITTTKTIVAVAEEFGEVIEAKAHINT